jgi:protocatechuate 3,4-dioxygenase, alpha subunit
LIFGTTPSQTVGPYFAIGLPWPEGPYAVREGTAGAITITGTVYDGAGVPVPDHLIEIWQADPDGRFADMYGHGGASEMVGFRGFARYGVEAGDGSFEILTVRPGRVRGVGGTDTLQAPHIDVTVMARGMLNRCVTRIYFADEEQANAEDPVLARVPADRRATLLAQPEDRGYRFDIRLQGPGETVFFDI